jgi:ferritin-like metal-binding protein YciE
MLSAEEQIVKALPNMVKAAESAELKDAFETHLEETLGQVERLKKVFSLIRAKPTGETCKAMEGLIKECKEVIEEFEPSSLRDAALIAKAQKIEHYEISSYGTLKSLTKQLDLSEAEKLLEETLKQEYHADKLLTKIAEGSLLTTGINDKMNK